MTNSTPTTEPRPAPFTTKEQAWYPRPHLFTPWPTEGEAWYCFSFYDTEYGDETYLWGDSKDAQKYKDLIIERHLMVAHPDSEYNYPNLVLETDPEILKDLKNRGSYYDQIWLMDEIKRLEALKADKANDKVTLKEVWGHLDES